MMATEEEITYLTQLLQNDFIMGEIKPIENLFENADESVLSEIDRLDTNSTLSLRRNKTKLTTTTKTRKNKKRKYNIPNATITRHSHFGQGLKNEVKLDNQGE